MIGALNPYPAMKDSGVPWLGDVPTHWEVQRLSSSVQGCINGIWGGEPNGLEDLPCVRVADFDRTRLRVRVASPTLRAIAPSERNRRLLQCGDLLLEKSGGGDLQPVGVVMLYDHAASAVCSNFVARMPVAAGFESGYLTYLHSYLYAIRLNVRSIKQTTGIQNLDSSSYLGELVAFPPSSEQAAIVRFLDYADRRIRRYVRAKQRLIELLEEQKQAIIHRAVTRGLDSNVRLKPTGVEWLGDVPEHWEVRRLKTLISRVTSGSRGWSNFAADAGVLFLRIGNLTRASIDLDMEDVVRLDLPKAVFGEATRTRVRSDDILLSITAFIGSVAIVPAGMEEAYVSQHVACCRPRPGESNPRWIGYVLLSSVGKTHGQLSMYGGAKQGLSLDDVKNYIVLLPPVDEQDAMVKWIESSCSDLSAGIKSARREISLLREYRTRLIADVVTGKLDVREAAARLPAGTEEVEPLDEADTLTDVDDVTEDEFDAAADEGEA
jgi:type I restriction enzyme S subunit